MVTADMTALEAKEQELQATQVEFSEAQAIANQEITELMATNPTYDLTFASKMADINKPVATLQTKIDRLQREFDKLNESNHLAETETMRSEVESTILEQIVGSVSVVGATGTVKIVDGKVVVQVNPVFSALDMDGIEAIIASQVDPVAFTEANLTSLALNVKDGVATLVPMGKKATTGTRGPKPKTMQFYAGGTWKTSAEFLKLVQDSGDSVAQSKSKQFGAAIKNGNGARDLAIETAARLNVESREKPTKAQAA